MSEALGEKQCSSSSSSFCWGKQAGDWVQAATGRYCKDSTSIHLHCAALPCPALITLSFFLLHICLSHASPPGTRTLPPYTLVSLFPLIFGVSKLSINKSFCLFFTSFFCQGEGILLTLSWLKAKNFGRLNFQICV